MAWHIVRYCILGKERELDLRYNMDIKVYGSGQQGYKLLRDSLYEGYYDQYRAEDIWNGQGMRTRMLRRQVHEYWVFLNIVETLLKGKRLNQRLNVFYQPCRGTYSQTSAVTINNWSVFVEPSLLPCSKNIIIRKINNCIKDKDAKNRIINKLRQNNRCYNTPDFLISKTKTLPWGALRIFGIFDNKEIEEAYNVEEKWQQWKNYWNNIKNDSIIIECKNEPLTDDDLIQVIWYKLCYDCEVVLISQHKIVPLYNDNVLNDCGVHVIDCCKICDCELREYLEVIIENIKEGEEK